MRIVNGVTFVCAALTGFALVAVHVFAQTQPFPAKPVRLVVPVSAGSQNDIMARILGPKLSDLWGHPVVIENRPGASGVIGADVVAKATPDGHTLLLTSAAFTISAAMSPALPYSPLRDFAGVTQVGFTTGVLVVAPSLGVKTVKEIIVLAQERSGKLLWGSVGVGSSTYMNGELFKMASGVKITHVGFKGQPEFIIEILAGRIHFAIAGLGPALPFIKDGRLLALAVGSPQRSPVLPNVPALAEVLPGYEKDGSYAMLAPAKTPRSIVNKIGKDVARVLDLAEVRQKLQAFGFVPAPTTPEEHDRILRAQIETFSRVARVAGLRAP